MSARPLTAEQRQEVAQECSVIYQPWVDLILLNWKWIGPIFINESLQAWTVGGGGGGGGVISEVHRGRRRWWRFKWSLKWQVYPWSGGQALHDEDHGIGRCFDSLYCLLMVGVLQIHSTNLFITEDREKKRGQREEKEIREDLKGTCI